jgi:predicted small metal-binding protein
LVKAPVTCRFARPSKEVSQKESGAIVGNPPVPENGLDRMSVVKAEGGYPVMPRELRCRDLEIKNCDFVVRGETPAELIRKAAYHLRKEHGISLPDAESIVDGRDIGKLGQPARMVAERLREALNIQSGDEAFARQPGEPAPNVVPREPLNEGLP